MNFNPFWSVENHSDAFFWKIALPVMAALIPMFMISDIKKKYRQWQRRRRDEKIIRDLWKDPNFALRNEKFLTLQL